MHSKPNLADECLIYNMKTKEGPMTDTETIEQLTNRQTKEGKLQDRIT